MVIVAVLGRLAGKKGRILRNTSALSKKRGGLLLLLLLLHRGEVKRIGGGKNG